MLFTSYDFIIFLILFTLLYYLVPGKIQWVLLLLGCFFFYFFSGWTNLIYLTGTSVCTYLCAVWIDERKRKEKAYLEDHGKQLDKQGRKDYKKKEKARQRAVLSLGILLCIGMLAVLKNFSYLNLLLPMGISFYIFQSVGYLIDVYRGKTQAEKNIFRYTLFVSFFPQLVQGPISRFDELAKDLYQAHPFDRKALISGAQRILWGYFKKMVIADRLLVAVTAIIDHPADRNGAFVFAGMVFYAAQLYCDFTGGIDITIGIAEMLGIRVTENFNRPYFSKSLKEFWTRWHITMGSWFRDYLFYPISVSPMMLKITAWSRKHLGNAIGKRVSVYISCFVVWIATGMWHGTGWGFIAWGLGNCIVLLISQEAEGFYRWFHSHTNVSGKRWWDAFRIGRTLCIVSLLRLFDCYRDVPLTFRMFGSMIAADNWKALWDGSLLTLGLSGADYIVAAVGILIVFAVSMLQRKGKVRKQIAGLAYPLRAAIWFGLFLAVLIFGEYGVGYDASQFIYNRF